MARLLDTITKFTIIIAINRFVSSVTFRNHADKALTEKSSECRALPDTIFTNKADLVTDYDGDRQIGSESIFTLRIMQKNIVEKISSCVRKASSNNEISYRCVRIH